MEKKTKQKTNSRHFQHLTVSKTKKHKIKRGTGNKEKFSRDSHLKSIQLKYKNKTPSVTYVTQFIITKKKKKKH